MSPIPEIYIRDYEYPLPEERIAQTPLNERDSSKLLIYKNGEISESIFRNITDFIPGNSFIALNDTKVIRARLLFRKHTGAKIEIFCIEPADNQVVESSFLLKGSAEWICLVGNASKWRDEVLFFYFKIGGEVCILKAEKKVAEKGEFRIRFSWEPSGLTFSEVLESTGDVPLPPYIKRKSNENDVMRYQTVYAGAEGSVAAPTAGLHFTEEILKSFREKSACLDYVTLNVGAGTFKPVKTEKASGHNIHSELFTVRKAFFENILNNEYESLAAVGTTTVRTLESLYWLGVIDGKLRGEIVTLNQWDVYQYASSGRVSFKDSVRKILKYMEKQDIDILTGATSLMIVPGYEFKVTDILITNFHMPRSSLLLLVAAFIGEDWKKVYRFAIKNGFRFLSYGDSSLLFRNE